MCANFTKTSFSKTRTPPLKSCNGSLKKAPSSTLNFKNPCRKSYTRVNFSTYSSRCTESFHARIRLVTQQLSDGILWYNKDANVTILFGTDSREDDTTRTAITVTMKFIISITKTANLTTRTKRKNEFPKVVKSEFIRPAFYGLKPQTYTFVLIISTFFFPYKP